MNRGIQEIFRCMRARTVEGTGLVSVPGRMVSYYLQSLAVDTVHMFALPCSKQNVCTANGGRHESQNSCPDDRCPEVRRLPRMRRPADPRGRLPHVPALRLQRLLIG